jgi:hypothetical protein
MEAVWTISTSSPGGASWAASDAQFAGVLRCSQALTRTHGIASSRPACKVKGRGGAAGWRRRQLKEERPRPIEAGRGEGWGWTRRRKEPSLPWDLLQSDLPRSPSHSRHQRNGRPWFSDRKTGSKRDPSRPARAKREKKKGATLLAVLARKRWIHRSTAVQASGRTSSYTYQR